MHDKVVEVGMKEYRNRNYQIIRKVKKGINDTNEIIYDGKF